MQTLLELSNWFFEYWYRMLVVCIWPVTIATIFQIAFSYIDKLLKFREPIADVRYKELIEAMQALRSDMNSIKIRQGFRGDNE